MANPAYGRKSNVGLYAFCAISLATLGLVSLPLWGLMWLYKVSCVTGFYGAVWCIWFAIVERNAARREDRVEMIRHLLDS